MLEDGVIILTQVAGSIQRCQSKRTKPSVLDHRVFTVLQEYHCLTHGSPIDIRAELPDWLLNKLETYMIANMLQPFRAIKIMSYNPSQNPSSWQSRSNSSNNYSEGTEQQENPRQQAVYKAVLSSDEIQALKECNVESFYYRCVPLATLFSGLAYIGMKNGYLQKSHSYGYVPKMVVGLVIGYIGGKFSYRSVCAEKIMKLPNSQLGETLRKGKSVGTFQESLDSEPGFVVRRPSPELGREEEIPLTEERRPDLSEHSEGIDSYNKVTENLLPYSQSDESSHKSYVTYDDLRRENREEYINKLTEKYKKQIPDPQPDSTTQSSFPRYSESPYGKSFGSESPPSKPEPYFNPKKNKYGDVWDD